MGKAKSQRLCNALAETRFDLRPTVTALAVAACFSTSVALANPTNPTVVHGTATFATAGNILNITNGHNAIINWGSFSIGLNELTRFIQPSALSAVLNRVTGQDPSAILGALQSNGRVFLINPNGIVFGPGAQIDVAGLVASTLNLSDTDFLANRLRFTDGALAGNVVNQGSITGGSVYLVGRATTNDGLITSPNGEVVLAAGNSVELVNPSTPNLRVEIVAPDNEARNLGTIAAEAGRIGIYAGLINNSGTLNASSAVAEGGRILLKATQNIETTATSAISANGSTGGTVSLQSGDTTLVEGQMAATGSSGTGGTVQVLGNRVGLTGNAQIDASGETGGGTVLVGGGFQGANPEIQNAQRTYVGSDVTIKADAINNGDGGKVIVWADDATRFYGNIAAQGGAISGNGGFAEVSGKNYLDYRGLANLAAPQGSAGNLLLDPGNIVINDTGSDNFASNGGLNFAEELVFERLFDAGDGTSTLTWTTILDNLAYGGVAITTIGSSGLSGDIDVQQGKTFASSNSLGLFAHRNIQVGSGAHIVNEGTGDIYMYAGWNQGSGTMPINAGVNSGVGDLTVNANISTLGEIFLQAGKDVFINNALINSGGPTATDARIHVYAYDGNITISNSTLRARGGDSDSFDGDIYLEAGGLWISGSQLSALGGGNGTLGWAGISADVNGDITIGNSNLTASGRGAWMDIYATASGPAVNLTNSSLNVIAADGGEGYIEVAAVGGGSTINAGSSNLAVQGVTVEGGEGYSAVYLFADGNITLGQVSAENVYVDSSNGAIIDGNVGLNVTANYMQMRAANGIGSVADPLETQGAYLYAYNSDGEIGKEIGIINFGDLNIYSVYNSTGNIAIGATGNLTVDGSEGSAGASMMLGANGNLNIFDSIYSSGPMTLLAGGDITIGGHSSSFYADIFSGDALTIVAGNNLNVLPSSYGYPSYVSANGITTLITGGNVLVDQSSISGNPDVVLKVGGVVNINGTLAYGGAISADTPQTIHLEFVNGTSGGYFVNGIEGVVFDPATNTGFFADGSAAVLGSTLLVTYSGGTTPVPRLTETLTVPTENLIVAMGESTKPPDLEKDKDVFAETEDEKKKNAPVCR